MRNSNKICRICMLVLLLAQAAIFARAQAGADSREALVKDVCEKLAKYYTFPDVGAELSRKILEKLKSGGYSAAAETDAFVEALNADLYQISRDAHLKLLRDPQKAKELKENASSGTTSSEIETDRWRGFGFKGLEILDGNIGYLNLTDFSPVAYGGERAATALSYFSDCRALIIDLRQNGGGSDDMVMFLASYFVASEDPIVLKISYSTIDNRYYSSETHAFVPGKKFADRPVYLLTSPVTASAAEAFISTLRVVHKDVTLVGRKTRGAENPVNDLAVGDEYVLRLPSWRTIFSAYPQKWEGVGIDPQIETAPDQALRRAHFEAVEKLSGRTRDESELARYQWARDGIKPFLEPVSVGEETLKSYEGLYGTVDIKFENGVLLYGRNQQRLIPISERYFLVEAADYVRVKFVVEDGRVTGLERIFVYGYTTRLARK